MVASVRQGLINSQGSGRADGFPLLPVSAQGFNDPTGSVRHIALSGTTDTIRCPNDPVDPGVSTLGWRRVDRFETGGAAVWVISWQTVHAFTGGTLAQLDDATWSNCAIKDGKFYAGFYDEFNGIGGGVRSYLLRADLATGAIEAVTPITAAVTAISATTRDQTMDGSVSASSFWWEIDDTGRLIAHYSTTTSPQTSKGIARVTYSSDLTSVESQNIYFDTSQVTLAPLGSVSYATEDFSVVVGSFANNVLQVAVPSTGQVLSIGVNMSVLGSTDFIFRLSAVVASSSSRTFNCVTEGAVAVGRSFTGNAGAAGSNGAAGISRPFVMRSDLDDYLKQLVFNFSGVSV